MTERLTTTNILNKALELKTEAKKVLDREAHARWWDIKVDLYHVINDALESGAFTGAAYDELWQAKNTLSIAEAYAGEYSRN